MFKHEKDSLLRVTEELKTSFSDRLKAVVAFGSRVRGDFHSESDFDILVIIENPTISDEEKIIKIISDEEERTGIPYGPVIKSLEAFEKERQFKTGFYLNIMKEGVFIYDSNLRRKESSCGV
jgi:predicted nucleotidyltransferase